MLLMAAIGAALGACSSDEGVLTDADAADGEAVTCTVVCEAPALSEQSRTYSDGQTAKNLYYALYATDENYENLTLDATNTTALSTIQFDGSTPRPKAQFDIQLVRGAHYVLVCFGVADGAPYWYDTASHTINVSYANAKCNDETRDGFYRTAQFVATKGMTLNLTLRRPFAQVNVGTGNDDWDAAVGVNAAPEKTYFAVKKAYTKLDVLTGEVSAQVDEAVFAYNDIPSGETFPVSETVWDNSASAPALPNLTSGPQQLIKPMVYLSMVYVLVGPETGQTFDCTFKADTFEASGDVWEIQNVPMQGNHRTNIYGKTLLSFTGDVTVEIDPTYDSDDYNEDLANAEETTGGYVIIPMDEQTSGDIVFW